MDEVYESKPYVVIDKAYKNPGLLIGEFDTKSEAMIFMDQMVELGKARDEMMILEPKLK